MPIHDWTRVSAGGFHMFHQDWSIELTRALNRGLLPEGFSALTDLRVEGYEPDIVGVRGGNGSPNAGPAVAVATPRSRQVAKLESDAANYARRANRIAIHHEEFGRVVAIIEIVSPGNKDTRHAVRTFVGKAVEFLRKGVHFVSVDLFAPTPRDPAGLPHLIWDEFSDRPLDPRPADKPLAVASFECGDGMTAYIDSMAVGDPLPDAPLFLAPGWPVNLPLETTYCRSWAETPAVVRNRVAPPA
jgi:hypothetical protein